jgi:hypothetical protein
MSLETSLLQPTRMSKGPKRDTLQVCEAFERLP